MIAPAMVLRELSRRLGLTPSKVKFLAQILTWVNIHKDNVTADSLIELNKTFSLDVPVNLINVLFPSGKLDEPFVDMISDWLLKESELINEVFDRCTSPSCFKPFIIEAYNGEVPITRTCPHCGHLHTVSLELN